MKPGRLKPQLLDANAWIGRWPFALRPDQTARGLARRLDENGISHALVSPLDSVLAPDPMPANRSLLSATRGHKALLPTPIINLRLTGWRENLRALISDTRVRAIRIVPPWHAYRVDARIVVELAETLRKLKLGLIVTVRLEDERQQHPALRIRGLGLAALATLLERVAPARVLCTGLYYREILELAAHENLLADTSMAEWDQTLRVLLAKVPARSLCFGTLTPFLSIPANVAKLTSARLRAAERRLIASENLQRLLGL